MAKALRAGLRNGGLRRGGLRPGLGNGSLFAIAPLDLFFARNRTLDERVTFTRASSGTYVGSDGLIKTATTNLLLRSEEFDNAYWTKNNSCTVSLNTDPAPNGTLTADQFNGAALVSTGVYVFPATSAGLTYTFSVYVKNVSNATTLRVGVESNPVNAFVTFNATTGVITSSAANVTSSSVSNVGNNWYRVSLTYTATGATAGIVIYSMSGSAATWLAWGAQLEQSSTVGEYIPTTSTINSAPRFDHNPATGESLGLLVEEQRTNSITNNTMVGAVAGTPGTMPTAWTFGTNTGGAISRQVVGTGTEDGIPYIDLRVFGTTPSSGVPEALISFSSGGSIAAANGQTWTVSTYLKAVGGSLTGIAGGELFVIYNQADGATLASASSSAFSYSLTPVPLVSTRRSHTLTASSALTAFVFGRIDINFALNTAVDFTLRIGLPQLEQGAFATSVIPTTTATVTRSADVASITGTNFSSWYRQDEGTVFADALRSAVDSRFPATFTFSDNTRNNEIYVVFGQGSAADGQMSVTTAGVSQAYLTRPGTASPARNIVVGTYSTNNINLVTNGSAAASDISATIPVVDRAYLGLRGDGATSINGTIRRLTYWPQRLSNSTLQTLTQ
jgi:hypothetical protein